MANLILGNGEFGQGLKFEARESGHRISHGPVLGPAGYFALRNNPLELVDSAIYVMTSTDGVTWTEQAHNINLTYSQISGIAYLNGLYIVYGSELEAGTSRSFVRINTSTDGVNWTSYRSSASIDTRQIRTINYANGMWQVFATGGGALIAYTSTNLTTWTQRLSYNFPNGTQYTYLTYSFTEAASAGNTTVAIAFGEAYSDTNGSFLGYETVYFRSTNGTSWTNGSLVGTIGAGADGWKPNSIAYGNNTWVVVGQLGNIYSSADGITWTARTSGITDSIESITFDNGKFVAESYTLGNTQAVSKFLTSTNGTTWTVSSSLVMESDDTLYLSNGPVPSYQSNPIYGNGKWIAGDYQSTDNAASWTVLDYQVPHKQPFIKYAYESGWNTWKTMDFWLFIPSHPMEFSVFAIASERGSWAAYIETQSSGSVTLRYRGVSLSPGDASITSTFNFGEWNHFRLVSENGVSSWYLNGLREVMATTGVRPVGDDTLNIGFSAFVAESRYDRNVEYYLDEFMLTDELLNAPTATSITVPTQPFINTVDTKILLHFDTNFEDDPTDPARNGEAALSSEFTEAVAGSAVYRSPASLAVVVNQTASPTVVRSAQASLASAFSLSTSALDLDLAVANIVTTSSLVANAGIIKQADSQIAVSASAEVINGRLIRAVSALEVNAFELIAVGRVQQFGAYIEVQASMIANAIKAAEAPIDVTASSSLTASISKNMLGSADLSISSSLVVATDKVKTFISTESITCAMSTTAVKTARTGSVIEATTALEVTTANTQVTSGTLFNQCAMTVSAKVTTNINVNLPAVSNCLAITNNTVRAEAALVVTAFELVIAKDFNLADSATWIVPVEDTTWSIPAERTDWIIAKESRLYKI